MWKKSFRKLCEWACSSPSSEWAFTNALARACISLSEIVIGSGPSVSQMIDIIIDEISAFLAADNCGDGFYNIPYCQGTV